jgi:hypothetical protein
VPFLLVKWIYKVFYRGSSLFKVRFFLEAV